MDHHRYLLAFLLVFSLSIVLAAAINYAVDPYDLFGSVRVEGLNQVKPFAGTRTGIAKPYGVQRAAPQVLIVGNSRPEMGLDPRSACWRNEDGVVYNLGSPAATVYRQVRVAQHALALGSVNQVFLGLDFADFVLKGNQRSPSASLWPDKAFESDGRLIVDRGGRPNESYQRHRLEDFAKGLFSLQALLDSLKTLLAQGQTDASTRRADGFNPAREYLPIIRAEGQGVLFAQTNRNVLDRYTGDALGLVIQGQESSLAWESLSRFLNQAKNMGVEPTLFINPYHAEYFAAIDVAGAWPLYEAWKRKVVDLVERQGGVSLWDFNTIEEITSESPPALGDKRDLLRWFWEPGHYRAELGDWMLSRMLGRDCGSRAVADFGILLSTQNLDSELEKLRTDLNEYEHANPEAIERLRKALPR